MEEGISVTMYFCFYGFANTTIKAFQFYKVEAFNNKLTKNLSKVVRFANNTIHKILKFYEGLKSGITYKGKKGPTNMSDYSNNNIF